MATNCSQSSFILFKLLVIFVACLLSFSCVAQDDQEADGTSENPPATEFDPDLPWLNVKRPLTLDDLKGKVVILDFWTYGCINCIHVLEDLRKLEKKFGDQLAVIGVHSPKFDNEKNLETLRSIIVRYDIEHPVVNDVDFTIGNYYGMRAWPTQVVIDPQGGVVGSIKGEGHYAVLDRVVAKLIAKHQAEIDSHPLPMDLEKDRVTHAILAAPGKVAISDRHVAISDTLHHRVILARHDGQLKKIFGGKSAGFKDGDADTARFTSPQGLAFNDKGLFVADTGNHAIRYIDLATDQVMTVAGGGEDELQRFGNYEALSVRLRSPWGVALRDSNLYIAMAGLHQIWQLDVKKGRLKSFAGSGIEGIRDGSAVTARFSQPSGLSLVGDWLYVADAEDSAVRRISLAKERVETLVGTGLFDFGDRDGPFEDAELQHVLGVAAAEPSRILIADTYNHKLKLLNMDKRVVRTLAGTGQPGRGEGEGLRALMNEPGGLAVLGKRVLIADTNNHRIMQYDLESEELTEWKLSPAEQTSLWLYGSELSK